MKIQRRADLLPSPSLLSRLQFILFDLQRGKHTSSGDNEGSGLRNNESSWAQKKSPINPSNWRTLNSWKIGINESAISRATWMVLKVLKDNGFEAYLVGGCVRDLLLKRVPKDFDVITTADIKEIKKQFNRCLVVGQRFPICLVRALGSIIEVSSFSTTQKEVQERKEFSSYDLPKTCNEKDILRWKNSMKRDFTINGLFFDPLSCTVYDYVNGLKDLRLSKVSTVIPAHLSFKEDCARILRGLRIAARLGFWFSSETASAISDLSSSISTLDKTRLLMELNFMLAYGAAESSIKLLKKYGILETLLPFQAAYLADQTKDGSDGSDSMLMKLFSNLDKLLATDCPCDSTLWLGLLTFHTELVKNPQDATVVLAFSSFMCYGTWNRALEFIKQNDNNNKQNFRFVPEISVSSGSISENCLGKETSRFACLVKSSVKIFTEFPSLHESLNKFYPEASHFSGQVFVSAKKGKSVRNLFNGLDFDAKIPRSKKRREREINYKLLKAGDPDEIRFVIGKVIMDTMIDGLTDRINSVTKTETERYHRDTENESNKSNPATENETEWSRVANKNKRKRTYGATKLEIERNHPATKNSTKNETESTDTVTKNEAEESCQSETVIKNERSPPLSSLFK